MTRTLLSLCLILAPMAAQAADMSFAEFAERRRAVVEQQVAPEGAWAGDFWRIYDEYTDAVAPLMAQRAALRGGGSEDDVEAYMDLQEELVDARKDFVRDLERADVPSDVIMSFLLLEQQLDAVYAMNEARGS